MKQYLISMYQPDGGVPPPEFLAKVMAEIDAMRAGGGPQSRRRGGRD